MGLRERGEQGGERRDKKLSWHWVLTDSFMRGGMSWSIDLQWGQPRDCPGSMCPCWEENFPLQRPVKGGAVAQCADVAGMPGRKAQ